jgi:uncharacterized cupredoxin-like copper-binding protein
MQRRTLIAAAALAPTAVMAHGKKEHAAGDEPVRKEQKPWGIAAEPDEAQRTIVFDMSDAMRFMPDVIEVKLGQTVHFDIRNNGKVLHEMVIGTAKDLEAHAALMAKFPNMEHDEPYMAHVAPGAKGRIVWTFNRAGDFEFACLIAGHFQAGMKGRIIVRS